MSRGIRESNPEGCRYIWLGCWPSCFVPLLLREVTGNLDDKVNSFFYYSPRPISQGTLNIAKLIYTFIYYIVYVLQDNFVTYMNAQLG